MESNTMTGVVKWFDRIKGFGFIKTNDVEEDIFVHYSVVPGKEGERNLSEGDVVTFELAKREANGRLYAERVISIVRS